MTVKHLSGSERFAVPAAAVACLVAGLWLLLGGAVEVPSRVAVSRVNPIMTSAAASQIPAVPTPVIRRASPFADSSFGTAHTRTVTKSIEQIHIFDRVLGTNPQLTDAERNIPEPDPATWRVLSLRMAKASGKVLDIKLARSLAWMEQVGAKVGGFLDMDLPEMGAVGVADVLAIDSCPPLKPGQGDVVTGTFAHEADDNLITLRLSDDIDPIGVTDNHPFWSEDRRTFIPSGHLKPGEHVRTRSGTAEVSAVARRPLQTGERVYNLEVHSEHVYQVTSGGVLVHNDCINYAKSVLRRRKDGTIIRMEPKEHPTVGQLPGYPVAGQPDGPYMRHAFHLENGILRDPANPRGIAIEKWLSQLGELNGIPQNQVLDIFSFMPLGAPHVRPFR